MEVSAKQRDQEVSAKLLDEIGIIQGAGSKSAGNLYLHPVSRGSSVVVSSVMDTSKSKQGPEHLLVLVHGIMASPKDWTYGEAVLKRRLGDDFFIYVPVYELNGC